MKFPSEGKRDSGLVVPASDISYLEGMSVIAVMSTHRVASMKADIAMLTSDVPLLDEAFQLKIVPEWLPVRSVISILTNKNETEGIIETVPPGSSFYHKPATVRSVTDRLSYWRRRSLFNNEASFADAVEVLKKHLADNVLLLENNIS